LCFGAIWFHQSVPTTSQRNMLSPSSGLKWQCGQLEGLYMVNQGQGIWGKGIRANWETSSRLQRGELGREWNERRICSFQGPPDGVMFLFRTYLHSLRSQMRHLHSPYWCWDGAQCLLLPWWFVMCTLPCWPELGGWHLPEWVVEASLSLPCMKRGFAADSLGPVMRGPPCSLWVRTQLPHSVKANKTIVLYILILNFSCCRQYTEIFKLPVYGRKQSEI
jgi:hypothetical protein